MDFLFPISAENDKGKGKGMGYESKFQIAWPN